MKKISVLLFIVYLTLGLNYAQNEPKKRFKDHKVTFGVKAGMNVSQLSTRIDDFFTDNYLGFKGGVFARFNFKKFHIQPELNFSMTGGEGVFGDGTGGSYGVKFNALEFPILAGYKVVDFLIFNLRIHGGAYGAYNLSSTIFVNDPNYPDNNNFSSDQTSKWNAGFVVGGGADIWRITLDLRYYWGLVNVMGDNTFQQDPRGGFKNGTFEITAGFKIF